MGNELKTVPRWPITSLPTGDPLMTISIIPPPPSLNDALCYWFGSITSPHNVPSVATLTDHHEDQSHRHVTTTPASSIDIQTLSVSLVMSIEWVTVPVNFITLLSILCLHNHWYNLITWWLIILLNNSLVLSSSLVSSSVILFWATVSISVIFVWNLVFSIGNYVFLFSFCNIVTSCSFVVLCAC